MSDAETGSASGTPLAGCPALDASAECDDPSDLRGEILPSERLILHAAELARSEGPLTLHGDARRLRNRIAAENAKIVDTYSLLSQEAGARRRPSPALEWLLDNSHIVGEQLREIDEDLPWGYLKKLPRFADGGMRGYPRMYGLCLDYLRHTDARIDTDILAEYVLSYQKEHPLAIGELWAIPILLRFGLILVTGGIASKEAEALALREDPRVSETDARPAEGEQERTREAELRRAHVQQAADHVTIGNAITSMRTIAAFDWTKFFGRTSLVESILRADPHGLYLATDDASRDRYRHVVEELAERSRLTEYEIAGRALAMAQAADTERPSETWASHVGFYLVDRGRRDLERAIGFRPTAKTRRVRSLLEHPGRAYFGLIGFLLAALLGAFALRVSSSTERPLVVAAMLLLAVVPASELVIALVNALTVAVLEPRVLSKLSLEDGIPGPLLTLVAVPAFIANERSIDDLLEGLEIRALGNLESNLHFALLSDFPDGAAEETDADLALLEYARHGIEALNRRYPGTGADRFLLLHRRRVWSAAEGVFMGWERKRGKLEELNRLILGTGPTTYSVVTAPVAWLRTVKYVLTLDADTELPRDTARKLVSTIAHPLNQAQGDASGRLVRGYGIIQPRIGTMAGSSRRSRFARIMAGPPGIDPYTSAISDVYQDLFGSGSFVGKAIYDVATFASALEGRVPENSLLSHDLFEGIFAHTALATDIELLDEPPSSYAAVAAREHRWIRGDFQLAPWLLRTVPSASGKRRSDLPGLGAWKLFDNLRRAMVAPSLVLLVLVGSFRGERTGRLALAAALIVLTAPLYARLAAVLFRPRTGAVPSLAPVVSELWAQLGQIAISAVFLLDRACLALDAAIRTAYRMTVSRKNLLEWQTASDATRSFAGTLAGRTWASAALAVVILAVTAVVSPSALMFTAPLLALWIGAPVFALGLSKPLPPRVIAELSDADDGFLRRIAFKTWRFFEVFVTEQDHFLPPDNYQEDPLGVVAHRTSPTNIGAYLLSIISARDLGFITLHDVVDRLDKTFTTMDRLDKHEGHVLNWYDSVTLRPIEPPYVSTVDSGNLVGYLWAIHQACLEFTRTPVARNTTFQAALDAFRLFRQGTKERPDRSERAETALEERLASLARGEVLPLDAYLAELDDLAKALGALCEGAAARAPKSPDEALWLERARLTVSQAALELRELAPFLSPLASDLAALRSDQLAGPWQALRAGLSRAGVLTALATIVETGAPLQANMRSALAGSAGLSDEDRRDVDALLSELEASLHRTAAAADDVCHALERVGQRAVVLADAMNFRFLYDEDRLLFSIGYNVQTGRLDGSYYDLLASEARLASLIAIAKGEVPEKHWFRLGRPLAPTPHGSALWSWSGSMFEYLMPLLVTRDDDETLLHETCIAVVDSQRKYGAAHGIPWGISESLFNLMDLSMTYQYRAFGVPGLGLKKGLEEDLVVTPYATALAAMVRPDLAVQNLRALEKDGLSGRYGFYEAIDYTPARLPPGRRGVVVKAFMAHHQGMTLVSLGNVLTGGAMQRRFHADMRVKTAEMLLDERVPVVPALAMLRPSSMPAPDAGEPEAEVVERVPLDLSTQPRAHLLGQGDASTIITSLGTGVTTWRGLDVSRFREDATLSGGGIFVYLRDLGSGRLWSAGFEPTRAHPDDYEAAFTADRVELRRRDRDIETRLEVVVSPEFPAEVRRITIINHGETRREIEVTTYTEVVLAPRDADRAHPAFGGLFMETEAAPELGALLAHRRRRSPSDSDAWVVQVLTPEEGAWSPLDYETSRLAFIGRGNDLGSPKGEQGTGPLGKTTGHTLDPALVLRRKIVLKPGRTGRVTLTSAVGVDRQAADHFASQFGDPQSLQRAFELGLVDARVELRHLGISPDEGAIFQCLLSNLVLPNPRLRIGGTLDLENARGRGALYAAGLSGDLPIVVFRMDDDDFTDLADQLLRAHELFRLNGFPIDLVLLNEETTGYFHPREDVALGLVRASVARASLDRNGGIHVRRIEQVPEPDRTILLRAAHVVISASKGSLSAQLRAARDPFVAPPRRKTVVGKKAEPAPQVERGALAFDNGHGGFDPDSGEYVMTVGPSARTPAPWCNVVGGKDFGFVVSESGASFSWSRNSQSHRLTPWSNDPVCDPSGEAIYLRDGDTGEIWSATPAPAGGAATYRVRHGFGVSVFEHERASLHHELSLFVHRDRPVKVSRLVLENRGQLRRKISVFGVVEWVLGASRERSGLTVATEWDRGTSVMLAMNPLGAHPERCAFFRATSSVSGFTGDRREFFGFGGSRTRPAALDHTALSGRTGAGLDPIAALEVELTLDPGARLQVSFVLGESGSRREALELAATFADTATTDRALQDSMEFWNTLLGTVQVKTPDAAFDRMMNGWLLYQTTSCRIFARSGFYQSSGAYGFRDQIQDVLALLHARPSLTREHLLRAAARQFSEGDVQHWWHADTGEGVRTRCSDDMLWLPFATAEYVRSTGDAQILDELVPFLEDKHVADGDMEVFGRPSISMEAASLYEHCARAIAVGTTRGRHGLPRMRGGDWNDGMNRVGGGDGGESVWLAWFLAKVLSDFSPLAVARGDGVRASAWQAEVQHLALAVEESAWDGGWYRRGYFEDGSVLGSAPNPECRIDAIAQSWAVISKLAEPARASTALDASESLLVNTEEQMMSLLWPPFDSMEHDPGYIRAYPPGVRENGGQYTHGVLWTVLARTLLGQGDRAFSLLSLLNPIHHGTREKIERYAVEPYVVAADIYAGEHAGRGGWTWYTGSAGWWYRIALEHVLGIRREGTDLVLSPCVPARFNRFEVAYRHGSAVYRVVVDNPAGVATGVSRITLDGTPLPGDRVPLVDDGRSHEVCVLLGPSVPTSRPSGPSPSKGGGSMSSNANGNAHVSSESPKDLEARHDGE